MKFKIIFLIILISFALLISDVIFADGGREEFPLTLYAGQWWRVPPGFIPHGLGGRENPHGLIIKGPFEGYTHWPK